METFEQVLYIDIDIHHGDGVEEAFYATNKVVTLSFHKHGPGFFPGTGSVDSTGSGRGKYHSINVPLPDGMNDAVYFKIFCAVTQQVKERFKPSVVVLQCGSDSLAHDPLGVWNITPECIAKCCEEVASWGLPLLVLGGGGYNAPNVARTWVNIIGKLTKRELDENIPEHLFFELYKPDFRLKMGPGGRSRGWEDDELLCTSVIENATRVVQKMPIKQ